MFGQSQKSMSEFFRYGPDGKSGEVGFPMRQCAFCTAINGPLLCSIHTYNRQNDATLHQKMIFFEKNADFRRTPFLHRGKSSVSAQYAFEKTLNTELKQRGRTYDLRNVSLMNVTRSP